MGEKTTEECKTTLLNVDDSNAGRYATSRILRQAGFEVREAATGAEALRLAQENPDLIVLDVKLPDINGFEVCRRIKADPATATIPVLHLSATYLSAESKVMGLESGAESYLTQPAEPPVLVATVKALLRLRQAEDALKRESAFTAAILDTVGALVIVLNSEGQIMRFNRACEDLTGYTFAEVKGRRFWDFLLLPEEVEPVTAGFRDLRTGLSPNKMENHWVAKDGRRRLIDWSNNVLLDPRGEVEYVIGSGIDVTARRRMEETIQHMASHDSLTGLPNRAMLDDRLTVALARARRHQEKLAVLWLDLDNFKEVNDTLGHSMGDALLQKVSARLTNLLRKSDSVARLGGDEFVELVPEIAREEDAWRVCQRIRDAFQQPIEVCDYEFHITTSIGIAIYPDDGEDTETLLKCADIALYRAKNQGRNNYYRYTPAMERKSV